MGLTYSIGAVAEETGLSTHTIRAWEKRYGVLVPVRSDTNRRVYGEHDVERLRLLSRAVNAGHSIGMIASFSDDDLARLGRRQPAEERPRDPHAFFDACRRAMLELDSEAFESALSRSALVLGVDGFLTDVVAPLLHQLDTGWTEGRVSVSQEHLASAHLRTQLDRMRRSIQAPAYAPRLLVTTPSGQVHELGAQLAAVLGARCGWNVTYLGPNLPASEIAAAVRQSGASVLALSLVYPEGDPAVSEELLAVRQALGSGFPILVGGRAVESYRPSLDQISAQVVTDGDSLHRALARIRV